MAQDDTMQSLAALSVDDQQWNCKRSCCDAEICTRWTPMWGNGCTAESVSVPQGRLAPPPLGLSCYLGALSWGKNQCCNSWAHKMAPNRERRGAVQWLQRWWGKVLTRFKGVNSKPFHIKGRTIDFLGPSSPDVLKVHKSMKETLPNIRTTGLF